MDRTDPRHSLWEGTLEERYKDDPVLLRFYQANLIRRGWAGRADKCEKEYMIRADPGWFASAVRSGKINARNVKRED